MADFADQVNGRGHYATAPTDDTPACKNCRFYRSVVILTEPGKCGWAPPPALARLYAALTAERMTQINYAAMFEVMPDALSKGACGAYERKVSA